MLNVAFYLLLWECIYAESRFAECRYAHVYIFDILQVETPTDAPLTPGANVIKLILSVIHRVS